MTPKKKTKDKDDDDDESSDEMSALQTIIVVHSAVLGVGAKADQRNLVQLTIKDMNAGSEIEKAIADEAVAKKRVETAEQNRLKAQKDAETKIINAKAEAESNKILEKRLTNKLLVQQYLKKWDGKLPTVSGDGNTMIDISQLMK